SFINTGYTNAPLPSASSTFSSTLLTRNVNATVDFIAGPTGTSTNISPLGTTINQLLFGNLQTNPITTTALQYVGNQGSILPFADVNGGNSTGDFATYTSNGIAPFSNYMTQSFSANGTLGGSTGDIVKVITTGTGTTVTAFPNQTLGALL